MASNNTASIAQARKLVEQLKMEANIDRIKVAWLGSWLSARRDAARWGLLLGSCQKPVVGAGTRWQAVFREDVCLSDPGGCG